MSPVALGLWKETSGPHSLTKVPCLNWGFHCPRFFPVQAPRDVKSTMTQRGPCSSGGCLGGEPSPSLRIEVGTNTTCPTVFGVLAEINWNGLHPGTASRACSLLYEVMCDGQNGELLPSASPSLLTACLTTVPPVGLFCDETLHSSFSRSDALVCVAKCCN